MLAAVMVDLGFSATTWWLLALNAAIALTLAGCANIWAGRDNAKRRLVGAVTLGAALATVAFAVVPPGDIPTAWYTPLQEGNSLETLSGLHGRSAHSGPNLRAVQEGVAGRPWLQAGDLMRANLWLSTIAALLFGAIAASTLGSLVSGAAAALVLGGNRIAVDAAVSELPSALLACYMMCGVVAVAAFWLLQAKCGTAQLRLLQRLRTSWLPLLSLALLAVATALTRLETCAVPLVALTSLLAHLVCGEQSLQHLGAKLVRALKRVSHWPLPTLVVVFAVATTPWWSDPEQDHVRWVLDALWPLNLSALLLFPWALQALPIAIVALAAVGAIHCARRPIRTGAVALSLVLLWRLYYSAGHGFRFELHRYGSMILPLLLIVALFGWREHCAWAARLWPAGGWRRTSIATLLLLCFVDAGYGVQRQAYQLEHKRQLMQGNLQVEARWALMHARRAPDAVLVSPVFRTGQGDSRRYLLFGGALKEPRELPRKADALAAELRRIAPGKRALMLLGRDCFLRGRPDCSDEVKMGRKIDAMRLESRPYNHYHFGVHRAFIHLQLHELPAHSVPAPP